MANEFVAILNKRDRIGITNAQFQIFNEDGTTLVTQAAQELAGEAVYRSSMPAGTPAGRYPFRLQRDDNDQALAFGEVFWDGTSAVTESELAQQSATSDIRGDIAALNNVSSAEISAVLVAVIGDADLAQATELQSVLVEILATQGLTTEQLQMLTFVRDVVEADEVLTPVSARKLLKGTNTVLVDKNVTSTTECNVNTSLIEAV